MGKEAVENILKKNQKESVHLNFYEPVMQQFRTFAQIIIRNPSKIRNCREFRSEYDILHKFWCF